MYIICSTVYCIQWDEDLWLTCTAIKPEYDFFISAPPEAEIDAELKDTLVLLAGAPMKLHAKIKGRPTPKVTWANMNTNIKDRQGIIIKVTDTDTMVRVDRVTRYDAGKYILNLDSVSGMKMYTIVVKVLGKFLYDHGYP